MNRRGEAGSQSSELVFLVPVIVIIIGLCWIVGRYAGAEQTIQSAANAAARDASLARSSAEAQRAGQDAARRVLADAGTTCTGGSVNIDSSGFSAHLGTAATVHVEVSCAVGNGSIYVPGIPGSKTFHATGLSPIDQYRER